MQSCQHSYTFLLTPANLRARKKARGRGGHLFLRGSPYPFRSEAFTMKSPFPSFPKEFRMGAETHEFYHVCYLVVPNQQVVIIQMTFHVIFPIT